VLRPLPNSLVTFRTPGGGGWGDPHTRDRKAVLADVAEGLVSPEAARMHYGVVVELGVVGASETRGRERPRHEGATAPESRAGEYSFGRYRAEFEAELPGEMQRALNRLVAGRPPIAQRFLRQALVETIRERRKRGKPLDLEAAFAAILRRYGLEHMTAGE
jgi:N-methylhydantoinase B